MPGSWCGAYGGVCKRVYMVYVGLMAAHVISRLSRDIRYRKGHVWSYRRVPTCSHMTIVDHPCRKPHPHVF